MAKAFFIRTLHGLMPEDDQAAQSLRGVRIGQSVAVEVSRPRNAPMMRLYWALCHAIGESIGAEAENISDVLKIKTGHFTAVKTRTETLKFPRSISFAKMTQTDFEAFYSKCCDVVISEWLNHLKTDELKSEIEQMTGVNYQAPKPRNVTRAA